MRKECQNECEKLKSSFQTVNSTQCSTINSNHLRRIRTKTFHIIITKRTRAIWMRHQNCRIRTSSSRQHFGWKRRINVKCLIK